MGKVIAIFDHIGSKAGMDQYNYGLSFGLIKHCKILLFTVNESKVLQSEKLSAYRYFGDLWLKKSKLLKLFTLIKGYVRGVVTANNHKVEVVHFHLFHFDILTYLILRIIKHFYKGKIIATIHDVNSFSSNDKVYLKKLILKEIQAFIVHNNFCHNELSAICSNKNISVIPHGNFLQQITPIPYNSSDTLNLLFFGQIKQVKGLDILLKAFNEACLVNRKISLTIAGNLWHESKDKYEKLIWENKSKISYSFEFIPDDCVQEYFEAADVVVLPYRKIYQSGVFLKALSYGRAVIVSDLQPFKEFIIDRYNGFLFNSEDHMHLSEVILYIADNLNILPTISQNAFEKLQKDFDWSDIGDATFNFYKSVVVSKN